MQYLLLRYHLHVLHLQLKGNLLARRNKLHRTKHIVYANYNNISFGVLIALAFDNMLNIKMIIGPPKMKRFNLYVHNFCLQYRVFALGAAGG